MLQNRSASHSTILTRAYLNIRSGIFAYCKENSAAQREKIRSLGVLTVFRYALVCPSELHIMWN